LLDDGDDSGVGVVPQEVLEPLPVPHHDVPQLVLFQQLHELVRRELPLAAPQLAVLFGDLPLLEDLPVLTQHPAHQGELNLQLPAAAGLCGLLLACLAVREVGVVEGRLWVATSLDVLVDCDRWRSFFELGQSLP
jgi:hypothetical protein